MQTTEIRQERRADDYPYYREIFRGRPMPFAYLDLDLFEENIQQIASQTGGKRIRVASKSLRCVAAIKRVLEADSCFQGIMCFTAREAVYLAGLGLRDLLIGYPTWNSEDLGLVARATAEGAQITLMIDSIAHIDQIERVAEQYQVRLPVCLDIDMSVDFPGLYFGVRRSPLRLVEDVRPVIERLKHSSFVWLDGVMGYEAQIAGVGDQVPGQLAKNTLVQQLKKRSIGIIARRRREVVDLIRTSGLELRFVNGGGTGSELTTRAEPVVTEITVGSGFYSPLLFDNYKDFRYQPAVGYAIEIVRKPAPGIYTCLGGGYTASGAAGPDKLPRPYLPTNARLIPLEGAGEVQTPVTYQGVHRLDLGDPIFMRHAKAGEVCERFTHLILLKKGEIVEEVPTYRGGGQCFL
ncbi:MAG TPA: amino acid deaminase/aldolase [Ktedonobacteraceae bacterium]|jgi:D-serine deaminase-like pyridoxal phosphate-dependent protein